MEGWVGLRRKRRRRVAILPIIFNISMRASTFFFAGVFWTWTLFCFVRGSGWGLAGPVLSNDGLLLACYLAEIYFKQQEGIRAET